MYPSVLRSKSEAHYNVRRHTKFIWMCGKDLEVWQTSEPPFFPLKERPAHVGNLNECVCLVRPVLLDWGKAVGALPPSPVSQGSEETTPCPYKQEGTEVLWLLLPSAAAYSLHQHFLDLHGDHNHPNQNSVLSIPQDLLSTGHSGTQEPTGPWVFRGDSIAVLGNHYPAHLPAS